LIKMDPHMSSNNMHNYMQWRHAGLFGRNWTKLADYAFFSVSPSVWYNRGINIGLLCVAARYRNILGYVRIFW
jgi:hypothetical protein